MPKSYVTINEALLRSFRAGWVAEGLAAKTVDHYCRHLRTLSANAGKGLLDMERADLEARVTEIIETRSASYAHIHARAFRRFYGWLLAEEEIETNPAARLRLPKVPEPQTKIASVAEIKALVDTCSKGVWARFGDVRDRALLLTLACSGLRISELARVHIEHVDLSAGCILIPLAKSRRPRIVGLDAAAAKAMSTYLRRLEATDGSLWRSKGGRPMKPESVKQAVDRRAEKAGVKISAHTFRRAMAASWIRSGGSQASLEVLCGWRAGSPMVRRYTSAVSQELALDEFRRLCVG